MEQSKATRDRLIDAAHSLALEKGIARTSVSDVLEAADTRKGSSYHYFPDMESLGLAVLENERVQFLDKIDNWLNAPTLAEGRKRFLTEALKLHEKTVFAGGCIWGNTALEMCDSNLLFAEFVSGVFDEWVEKIEDVIQAGQECGQLLREVTAHEAAGLVVSVIEGGVMLSCFNKESVPLEGTLSFLHSTLAKPESAAL